MLADLVYLALISLGSYKLTEVYKEIMRRLGLFQPAWWKSFVNLLISSVLVLLVVHRSTNTKVLIAVGSSGFAALIHASDTSLRSYRDWMVSAVLDRNKNRRR